MVADLVRAGLGACALTEGRVPIGATALPGRPGREAGPDRGGEPPVGDELLVRLFPIPAGGLDWGLALLLAREIACESPDC